MIAVAAFAGTSAFSMISATFSCTSVARNGRVHVSVRVAYFTLITLPVVVLTVLIVLLLSILKGMLEAGSLKFGGEIDDE